MKKFAAVLLALLMLCPAAFAKDYIQMISPDGTEVSVYKTAVAEYGSLGYVISDKEKEGIWTSISAVNGQYVNYSNISNGKLMYSVDNARLTETDLTTSESKELLQLNGGEYYDYELLTVYNGKVYFCEYYWNWNYDYSWEDYRQNIYSYNLSTGECTYENLRLNDLLSLDAYVSIIAYDDKVIAEGGQDYLSLFCYDFVTDTYTEIGYDCASFPCCNGIYYIGLDIDETGYPYNCVVRYYNFDTQCAYDVCVLGTIEETFGSTELTNEYAVYKLRNDDGTYNAYIRYYNESEPKWLMTAPDIFYTKDELGNIYLLSETFGENYNIYSYKNGILEYCNIVQGRPLEILNGTVVYEKYSELNGMWMQYTMPLN